MNIPPIAYPISATIASLALAVFYIKDRNFNAVSVFLFFAFLSAIWGIGVYFGIIW